MFRLSKDWRRCGCRAFTLIELLVVVSIIALLVSILMPALSRARGAAATAVCLAHLRQAGLGLANYTAENNDWLAGPNTAGKTLSIFANWNRPDMVGQTSTAPVQNVDWVSPTLGDSLGLPGDRKDRIEAMFNTDLHCPANRVSYDLEHYGDGQSPLFSETEVRGLTSNSYGATQAFHMLSFWKYKGNRDVMTETVADAVELPADYQPRQTRVGRASEKIYAVDGTRYVGSDGGQFQISFNAFVRQLNGGNYMVYGPVMRLSGDPWMWSDPDAPEFDEAGGTVKFSFRHNRRINAVYFDGHGESLDLDRALDVRQYFPRGSRIVDAGYTYDPRDRSDTYIN